MHQYYVPVLWLLLLLLLLQLLKVSEYDSLCSHLTKYPIVSNITTTTTIIIVYIYIRERRHTHTRNIIYLFICQINRYLICDQHNNDDDDKT